MKLLLGTTNPAKVADYKMYLNHAKLELIELREIGLISEPEETEETFEGNALLKAKHYAEKTEYPALSDDGGFEIDALDGKPGAHSNRWLGPQASNEDKINKVLELLEGFPEKERTARLKAVTVVYFPDVRDYVMSQDSIAGYVPKTASKKIVEAFPYRSLLFLPGYDKFFSELTDNELKEASHRRQICKRLLLKMEPFIN